MVRRRIQFLKKTFLKDLTFRVGIGIGLVGLLLSLLIRLANPGRLYGDPLPILLILSQILRGVSQGILYIHWGSVLQHLLFLAFLALSSVAGGRSLTGRGIDPARAAQVAGALNTLVIAFSEVDSVMVGFWYLAAGYLSIAIVGVMTRVFARVLRLFQSR